MTGLYDLPTTTLDYLCLDTAEVLCRRYRTQAVISFCTARRCTDICCHIGKWADVWTGVSRIVGYDPCKSGLEICHSHSCRIDYSLGLPWLLSLVRRLGFIMRRYTCRDWKSCDAVKHHPDDSGHHSSCAYLTSGLVSVSFECMNHIE
jgi:hypothetical protein